MTTAGRAVVTGGAGLLGSHLCTRLPEDGCDVACSDDSLTGGPEDVQHLLPLASTSETYGDLLAHPQPEDDPAVRRPDTTPARTALGRQPEVPLRDGLLRTNARFREQLPTTTARVGAVRNGGEGPRAAGRRAPDRGTGPC
ncbi:nucleoside-diphosphate-sugar epimerase [Geodermatophilus bullaregiensis]|uniref:NAD-dependent epimerase/dehydratase family protein n=1 Tax=Geodermatophilus bullaregiensis TaxID=1564160 RepID=UPI00195C7482|nr:NAD-dependent epimerase/dehydratase family protein [Geodermatophilus bullaregiensis]MBM7804165.1 nucleoside-diphosphate-sugar epimerase [Geodermatophilus bullaregiensis]